MGLHKSYESVTSDVHSVGHEVGWRIIPFAGGGGLVRFLRNKSVLDRKIHPKNRPAPRPAFHGYTTAVSLENTQHQG